jgi:alpha-tubulin suppressor-like RCC1 family protein
VNATVSGSLTQGSVYCWGANGIGQLGNGTTTDSHLPVPTLSLTSGISTISSGPYENCALKGGAVWCWGQTPAPFAPLASGVTAISPGSADCAVVNQAVQCWGYNDHGQLGNGTMSATSTLTPAEVVGL